jgi:hypothetical protein
VHVVVDAFDRRARAFEKAAPVFRVGREDLVLVAIDERLKDAFDVRANRGSVSGTILSRRFRHKKAQKAQNEN